MDSADALLDELTNSAFRAPSVDRVYAAPVFGELPPVWAFRGQRDATWKLASAAFRSGAFARFTDIQPTEEAEYQQTEWTLVMHEFRKLADEFGHHVPGDSLHLRVLPPRYEPASFGPDRSFCITADFPSDKKSKLSRLPNTTVSRPVYLIGRGHRWLRPISQ